MTPGRALHAILTAGQFLTRLRLPGGMNRPDADPALLADAVPFFPLGGALIGAATGGVTLLALAAFPPPVAAALGLAMEALLTGAFHEDAVADTCDAFGGGWERDDVLRILKDSRVGSYGTLGLTLAVLIRWQTIAALPAEAVVAGVVTSAALGRWGIVLLMAAVPPVPAREGLAKDVGRRVGIGGLVLASLLTLPSLVLVDPTRAAGAVVLVAAATLLWGRYVRGRLGGVTGDALGFAAHLGQCLTLLVLVAK